TFHNMWVFYSLAIPSVITCCADWVCFDLLTIGVSYFGAHQIAGTAIMNNTIQIFYQFSSGLGIGTSSRIGSLIRAAKPRQTHIASDMAIQAGAALVVSCTIKLFYMSFIVNWKNEVCLCLIQLKSSDGVDVSDESSE
ncbi:hypothetical protein LPJ72_002638, partial [Coemansia sp. Benny D160-2]